MKTLTRQGFIRKWLDTGRLWTEHNKDEMRADLDRVIAWAEKADHSVDSNKTIETTAEQPKTAEEMLRKTLDETPAGDRYVVDALRVIYYRKDIVFQAMEAYAAQFKPKTEKP